MITGYSGSPLRYFIGALRNRLPRPFLVKAGSVNLPDSLQYDYLLEKPRSNIRLDSQASYSYGYEIDPVCLVSILKPLLSENLFDISRILGSGFLVNNVRFWRNLSIPRSQHSIDHYSNVFHQDTVVDQNLIQIFILLTDVDSKDGPFEWYEKDSHSKAHKFFKRRSDTSYLYDERTSPPIPKQLTGSRGSYLLLNTGYHYHRDGIPEQGRDRVIMSVGLFPSYTKIGIPSESIL